MSSAAIDEKEVFSTARRIAAPEERVAFVQEACGGDPVAVARILDLLRVYVQEQSFLEAPVLQPQVTTDESLGERPGTLIGPYKLLQQIGEGGMGTVWMAEQSVPIQRKVALKIIKAGMDSKQVIARFEAERQALAMMDHVNIARVFDAGATEAGRPYFVMELVHGVPITKYCDDKRLTPRERLELFVPVCQAIQHAHQKGIVHRDIKPSNVMVTLYDGRPVPKVIDFGVAKATAQPLTERTLFTQYGGVVGTLEYMSPEQAELSALGVDTRSDIYSLGVLLYELLTGSTPLTHKRMVESAYAEILRLIKEEEPPRPSTRLSDSGEALASISANRHTEPAKLSKLMRGELDWIVMKCLEKDRNRRYETANGFALDVQRYLADEPVLACPPSVGYRTRKFVRRNRGPVVAVSFVVVALVGGLIGTTWGMLRARTAEADAAREAEKKTEALAEAKTNLGDAMAAVDQLLTRLGDERLVEVPQMEPIRRELLQDALNFYQKFLARRGDDRVIRWETARCYRRMGRIYFDLGQKPEANEAFLKAIAMMDELGAASSRGPDQRVELFCALGDHCWVLDTKADQCVLQRRRAVEVAESLVADFGPDWREDWLTARIYLAHALIGTQPEEAERILKETLPLVDDLERLGSAHSNLGFLYWSQQRWSEAVQQFRLAVEQRQKGFAVTPEERWPRRALALAMLHLAHSLARNQQLAEAEQYSRKAIPIFERLASEYPKTLQHRQERAIAQAEHAGQLKQLGNKAEAEEAFRRAADLYEKLADDFQWIPQLRESAFDQRITLGRLLIQEGRQLEAREVLGKASTVRERQSNVFAGRLIHRQQLVRIHLELARLFKADSKTAEAQQSFDQGVDIQQALENDFADKPEFRRELASAHLSAAHQLGEDGRVKEAERFYRLAKAHWLQIVAGAGDDVEGLRGLATTYSRLGELLEAQSRKRDAEDAFANAIETLEKLVAVSPKDVDARAGIGHSQRLMAFHFRANPDRPKEAENHLREALRLFEALHSELPGDAASWHFLADTYRQLGYALNADQRPQEAEESFRRAVELHEQRAAKLPAHPEFNPEVSQAYSDLGDQLVANGRGEAQAVASLSKRIEYDSKNWRAWNRRGEAYAQLKEWEKARADFAKSIELAPQEPLLHYRHALACLALADIRQYRTSCAAIVSRFGTSSDLNTAYWTVWTCVLAPDAVADWRPVVQIAEKAVADDSKNCAKLQALAAVLYRAGRYPEAANRLKEAEAAFAVTPSPRTSPDYTGFFQAMSLRRQDRLGEAQQRLRKVVNDIEQPSEQPNLTIAAWDRRLTLQLLRQEAEDLLK